MKKGFEIDRVRQIGSYDLPAGMSREIGRVIVRWAYFEGSIQDLVRQVLGLSDPVGRIAIREPKASERLEMLRDLVQLRGASWDDTLCKSMIDRTNQIARDRHLIAHGSWVKTANHWHIQVTRGSWLPVLKDRVGASTKKVVPELRRLDMAELRNLANQIDALIEDLRRLRKSASGPPLQWQQEPE